MTKILIVDDNEQNIYMLKVLLNGNGYDSETAKDGAEALKIARSTKLDLIISDILMPGLDGYSLCREWQKDDQLKNIPFIFYTATYTDSKDEKLALSLGAERFIIKPAEPDEFIEIVRDVLKHYEAGKLAPPGKLVNDEEVFLKKYNQVLIHKLEDKMLTLEQSNQNLKQQTHDLSERVKELNCLYNITKLAETPDITIEEMIRGTVDLIPNSYQYPDVTGARIKLYDDVISSSNFKKSQWKQTSNIIIRNQVEGVVEVAYLEEKPESDEGPFLKEERHLINAISIQLGGFIERVQAEEVLQENHRYYRSLLNHLHEDVIVIDREYKITDVNNTYLSTSGYHRDEVIGKHCYEISHGYNQPCEKEGEDCKLQEVFINGNFLNCIHEHLQKDGSTVWVDLLYSPLKDKEGNITHVIETVRDISDLMTMQNTLRKSEEQYRAVVEDSPGIISRFLPDGTITFVNQEYCKYFGKEYDQVIGSNIQSTIPEGDIENVMSSLASLDAESPIQSTEIKNIKSGSEISWMRWTDRALFDNQGQIMSIQSFGQDITAIKKAEQALRQEQEKAQKYLSIAEVMILALNSKGEITLINQKGNNILGYKEDELLGKNWFDTCVPTLNRNKRKQFFRKVMAGEVELGEYNETPVLTMSGEVLFIGWQDTVLWDEKGHIVGSLSSGEDITERLRADEEIKSLSKFPDENPNPVLRFSKEGKILYASNSSAVLLNKWGRSIGESAPTDWKKHISKSLTSYKNLGIEEICENRIISFILSPIKEMDYVNAYGRDITKPKRAHQLLNALNQASVTMGTALTQQEIFKAVARELEQLDISCMLFPTDETQGKLFTKYLSFESATLTAVEKLLGIKHEDFSFPIETIDMYREVISEKKTLFIESSEQIVWQILPKPAKKFSTQILKLLRVQKNITAPLIVEGQVIGVFSIQSDNLTQEDIPAATAFADQLSSAWNKIGLLQNLKKTVDGTIHTIAATVEARDPYTAGHQTRVADLAAAIATEMHLSREQVEGIRMGGIIHDLGKINVPAEILSKPGKLSELEFNLIKTHPQVGFDLLKEIEFPWPIAQMVHQHHEKMNGSGYPQGLKGDEILLEARILAVSDIVEAMSSHRPFRPALGIEKALNQIKQDKGTLLDPDLVDACLKIFKEGYKLLEN